jgi:hypothetical protein
MRLLHWRERSGIERDQNKWLFVLCHTLAPLKDRDGGLDLYHLHAFQRRCPLPFDDDDAVEMIHKVCNYRARHPNFRNLSSDTVGTLLDVTAKERDHCHITTMENIEETAAARRKRQKAEKRQRDRDYQREQRMAAGRKPHAESASQTKPWIVAGFGCRRTWERHGKPTTKTRVAKMSPYISLSKRLGDTFATPSQPNRRSQVLEGVGGGVLGFAARPSSSRPGSCYGTAAKIEAEQASLAGFRFSTLGMGSSGTGIDPQIWPLVSGSAKVEAEQAALGCQWYNLRQRKGSSR